MLKPTASDISKISKCLNTNKATGPDGIPAKFGQMSAYINGCHLSNIITCDILKNKYSEHAKTATEDQSLKKMIGQKLKTTCL